MDAKKLLDEFTKIASFDHERQKFYFVFADKERGGQYTLMKKGTQWSIHGKGETYCDPDETMMNNFDELINFVWKHRSRINQVLKDIPKKVVNG